MTARQYVLAAPIVLGLSSASTLPLRFQADTKLLEYICNENNRYFEIVPRK